MADPHPELGSELAGGLPLSRSRFPAGRVGDFNALPLRQFEREPAQSELASEARQGGKRSARRNGTSLAASAAARARGSPARTAGSAPAAPSGTKPERFCGSLEFGRGD